MGEAEFKEHLWQVAKQFELENIRRVATENHDWDNPYGPAYRTPAEHALQGSTASGKGFNINVPIALFAGKSLSEVNQMRERATHNQAYVRLRNKPGTPIHVEFKLLPITTSQLESEQCEKTFEIITIDGNIPDTETLYEVEEYINNRIKTHQSNAQEYCLNEASKTL